MVNEMKETKIFEWRFFVKVIFFDEMMRHDFRELKNSGEVTMWRSDVSKWRLLVFK